MPVVSVTQETPLDADDAYRRLKRTEDYPKYADSVLHVNNNDSRHSEWSVKFRTGILQWIERDNHLDEKRTIEFEQVNGDFDSFSGSWTVSISPSGATEVQFKAAFDLGIPSLAEMLNPVACDALSDNVSQIINGIA